jgi:hypothetical protein
MDDIGKKKRRIARGKESPHDVVLVIAGDGNSKPRCGPAIGRHLQHVHFEAAAINSNFQALAFLKKLLEKHGRMARGGHGLPKVSLGPTMPNPFIPCRQVTPETALWSFQR